MSNRFAQLADPIKEELEARRDYAERCAAAKAELAAISKETSAKVLARRPDQSIVEKLAKATAMATIAENAVEAAEERLRDLALPLARYTAERYTQLRRLLEANVTKARNIMCERLAEHFPLEQLDAVVGRTHLVQKASLAYHLSASGAVGYTRRGPADPAGTPDEYIHPSVTPETVLSESEAVERAYLAAEEFAKQELR